ncbi:MAG: hypothetical protein ACT4QG_22035 [Sporichthyaceae bacterium]
MGEHGKRAVPHAHGGRAAKAPAARSWRWGPLTAETAIVLGVAGAIVAGAFFMDAVRPTNERTNTTVGKDTVEVHQLGKGGIKPGPVQPRVIAPPKPVVAPTATSLPTPLPKPVKTATAVPTVAPTQEAPVGGGGPLLGGGGGSDPTTKPCGLLGLAKCPKEDDTTSPSDGPGPGSTSTPAPETDTGSGDTDENPSASLPR